MTGHGNETRELAPVQELESLDELWFQVGGTLCNLSCNHCFISCHPGNDTFGFLSIETVRKYLRESEKLGVREYYFTGGEPFLNRDMMQILEETLSIGPATVLTNGTVFTPASIRRLRDISQASSYSLELRVS
ncbi:MAG: radical SAM protein, partial [Planctomycetota bacterium]|nr:radical SAM protein [Planctomycetota bacterium]